MNKTEKRVFVRRLLKTYEQRLIDSLHKVPEHWDGVELRTWVAEVIQQERCYDLMSPVQVKNFKNDLIVHNL